MHASHHCVEHCKEATAVASPVKRSCISFEFEEIVSVEWGKHGRKSTYPRTTVDQYY